MTLILTGQSTIVTVIVAPAGAAQLDGVLAVLRHRRAVRRTRGKTETEVRRRCGGDEQRLRVCLDANGRMRCFL